MFCARELKATEDLGLNKGTGYICPRGGGEGELDPFGLTERIFVIFVRRVAPYLERYVLVVGLGHTLRAAMG